MERKVSWLHLLLQWLLFQPRLEKIDQNTLSVIILSITPETTEEHLLQNQPAQFYPHPQFYLCAWREYLILNPFCAAQTNLDEVVEEHVLLELS